MADLLGELEREVAAQRQHLLNRRHQANGQSKPEQEKSQVAPTPKTCAKVTHGNGVKPSPEPAKTPARGRRARANAEDVHSLKPIRSISGLTIAEAAPKPLGDFALLIHVMADRDRNAGMP